MQSTRKDLTNLFWDLFKKKNVAPIKVSGESSIMTPLVNFWHYGDHGADEFVSNTEWVIRC